MFGICEKYMNAEKIIYLIKSEYDFMDKIHDHVTNIHKLSYDIIIDSADALDKDTCVDGYYILFDNDQICLLEKRTKNTIGIIYNSKNIVINTMFTWTLVEIEEKLSKEIKIGLPHMFKPNNKLIESYPDLTEYSDYGDDLSDEIYVEISNSENELFVENAEQNNMTNPDYMKYIINLFDPRALKNNETLELYREKMRIMINKIINT